MGGKTKQKDFSLTMSSRKKIEPVFLGKGRHKMTKIHENLFWNSYRAKNFMKKLGIKPKTWNENLGILAELGKMSVEELMTTDPISYGVKIRM